MDKQLRYQIWVDEKMKHLKQQIDKPRWPQGQETVTETTTQGKHLNLAKSSFLQFAFKTEKDSSLSKLLLLTIDYRKDLITGKTADQGNLIQMQIF